MWRYGKRGQLRRGYPAPFKQMFIGLPDNVHKVDAVYERPGDNYILFFIGDFLYNFLYQQNPLLSYWCFVHLII